MADIESVKSLVRGVAIGATALMGLLTVTAVLWAGSVARPVQENSAEIKNMRSNIATNTATNQERMRRLERIEQQISEVGHKLDRLIEGRRSRSIEP